MNANGHQKNSGGSKYFASAAKLTPANLLTINSTARVRAVDLSIMFDWKWQLSDIQQDKPVKVFSCFSGIGGSSLGYKRAGFEVLGNIELDSRLNKMYRANLHPKYNYNCDISEFNQLENLPEELYQLDILDGSPPCTPFTVIGKREKGWDVTKKFEEGQKEQRLDMLPLEFLNTVEKLKSKIVVMENVKGLISGNARGYVNEILNRFADLGYEVQMFLLNACFMDVPQVRGRVFFIANNQHYPKLKLDFHGELILFGDIREPRGKPIKAGTIIAERMKKIVPSDIKMAHITWREEGKPNIGFCHQINHDWAVAACLTKNEAYRAYDKSFMTMRDRINVASFPQDYKFSDSEGLNRRALGYSVPPNMMANIATEIYNQWLAR